MSRYSKCERAARSRANYMRIIAALQPEQPLEKPTPYVPLFALQQRLAERRARQEAYLAGRHELIHTKIQQADVPVNRVAHSVQRVL